MTILPWPPAATNAISNGGGSIVVNADGSITMTPASGATFLIGAAPPITANYGLVSIGNGPFDGSSSGHFVGNAAGTGYAANFASGYTGDLLNLQLAGVSKMLVRSGSAGGILMRATGGQWWIGNTLSDNLGGANNGIRSGSDANSAVWQMLGGIDFQNSSGVATVRISNGSGDFRAQRFTSGLAGGGAISSGSGVPTLPNGVNPNVGDVWYRTDTPTVANQFIYVCTVGGATPTWVGKV